VTKLYRFYDAENRLLYVGVALNFIHRLAYHMCKHHNDWCELADTVKLQRFASREEALDAEEVAIRDERPMYNVYLTKGPRR
jgi:excinuclease UvrABC nuclease subunit